MLKLYSMTGTCALAVHIALEWAQLPFELRILERGENRDTDYLQINPLGTVPALRIDDGSVLTEASALLTYIDARVPEAFSAPSRDAFGRARLAETLSFFTTELHAAFAPHFAPARFHPNAAEHDALRAAAYERLRRLFDLTDGRLTGRYIFGDQRSVADPYLYVLTRWIGNTPLEITDFPSLAAFNQRMKADPGVRAALSRYKMGPAPGKDRASDEAKSN